MELKKSYLKPFVDLKTGKFLKENGYQGKTIVYAFKSGESYKFKSGMETDPTNIQLPTWEEALKWFCKNYELEFFTERIYPTKDYRVKIKKDGNILYNKIFKLSETLQETVKSLPELMVRLNIQKSKK